MDYASEILKSIKESNDAFEQFKSRIDERLNGLEDAEAKANRPGFFGASKEPSIDWKSAFDDLKNADFTGKVQLNAKAVTTGAGGISVPGVMQPLAITGTTNSQFISDYIPARPVEGPSAVVNRIGSTDLAGEQVNEGDTKQMLEIASSSAIVPLKQIAAYSKVSVQALEDVQDLQSIVTNILHLRVRAKIDSLIWSTANTAGNNTAYVSASTTPIDNIVGALAVMAQYGLTGTVFLSPVDYATLMLTKASTAGMFLGLPDYSGLVIRQASAVPAGKFLITTTDGAGVGVAQRSQILVVLGFDSDDLTRNLRTILVEQRTVPFVTDPTRVMIGDLVKAA